MSIAPAIVPFATEAPVDDTAPHPPVPRSIADTGLRTSQVIELALKAMYVAGECPGQEIARTLRLPYSVLDEVFAHLRREMLVQVRGLEGVATGAFRFQLTEAGRSRAREFLERSQYVGPAPVPLDDYRQWVGRQAGLDRALSRACMDRALSHLVVPGALRNALVPAVNSRRPLFLYGPAGNGKTTIAEAIASAAGGAIFVPHAIDVDGHLIRVFDPSYHESVEPQLSPGDALRAGAWHDRRWVLTRRPVVLSGGELTLPMLDLQFNPTARYYEAPFQVKANGGVFIIDDFGRQLVKPHDLLNRWIVPLEKREDYLTLHTGKKFAVPFECLIIFATNLDPAALVDEAFLRRIRYKIPLGNPSRAQYESLFESMCGRHGIRFEPEMVEFVFSEYYGKRGLNPRFCHPRDLVEHMADSAAAGGEENGAQEAGGDLLARACEQYFLHNPFGLEASGHGPAASLL